MRLDDSLAQQLSDLSAWLAELSSTDAVPSPETWRAIRMMVHERVVFLDAIIIPKLDKNGNGVTPRLGASPSPTWMEEK